jgi:hypothetical protein
MSSAPSIPVGRLRDSAPGVGRQLADEISRSGDEAVMALLRFLSAEGENHIVRNHAFEALRTLGRQGMDPTLVYLREFDRFDDATQVYIAKGLVRLVGDIDADMAESELIGLIRRLIGVQEQGIAGRAWHFIQQIKMEIHAVLAANGCSTMLDDLLALLGSGEELVFPVVIQAIGLIGDRRALLPLLRLHALEGDETWLATEIRKSFRRIIRREGVDRAELGQMTGLTAADRTSLEQLLQSARRRNGNG